MRRGWSLRERKKMRSADIVEYEKKQKQEKIKELSGKIFDPEQSYTAEEMEALAQKRVNELNQFHQNEIKELQEKMMDMRKEKFSDRLEKMGLGTGLVDLLDLSSEEACETAMNTITECMCSGKKEEKPKKYKFPDAVREVMGIKKGE